ncbi:MAG: hypothetical protein V1944_00580, partial [Candidatus Aenigmatarchaeota archaeon]
MEKEKQNMKEEKKTGRENKMILIVVLTLAIFVLPFVAADEYALYCLREGEQINFGQLCNPAMDPRTGPTNICVHILDSGKICPTLLNICNSKGLQCQGANGNTTIDSTPPKMNLLSPIEGKIYSSKRILLSFSLDEKADVQYVYKNDPNGRWKKVCSGCSSYQGERNFEEGLNELTLRAEDKSGNEAFFDLSFRVDSAGPRIKDTEPKEGFASGEFFVEFEEENPVSLILKYGNQETGMRERKINIT